MIMLGFIALLLPFLGFAFKKARTVRENGFSSAAALVSLGSIAIVVLLIIAAYPFLAWASSR